jgi:hypothetical protein
MENVVLQGVIILCKNKSVKFTYVHFQIKKYFRGYTPDSPKKGKWMVGNGKGRWERKEWAGSRGRQLTQCQNTSGASARC